MTTERTIKGPRNRPRAKLVCANCRSRKVKCDAEKLPQGAQCTPCRASKSSCHVDPGSDRRRHGAAHHRLAEMQERIRSLEAMVKPQSSAAQPESESASMNTRRMSHTEPPLDSPSAAADRGRSQQLPQETMALTQSLQHDPLSPENISSPDWRLRAQSATNNVPNTERTRQDEHAAVLDLPSWAPSANFSPLPNGSTPRFRHSIADINISGSNPVASAADTTETDDENAQVYREPGTDDVAFYGSTTQSHLRSPNNDEDAEIDTDNNSNGNQDTAMNLDSVQLQKVLLNIFFKVQPNTQIIVHEDLFRRDKSRCLPDQRSKYYSNFLESAMLASAARHSTSVSVRGLVRRYAQRAKDQITSELDHPNIATLQGFLILSDLEATRGRARTGWTYCSIATGLLIDLALHVEPSEPTNRGDTTPIDTYFRSSLLLGTFVYATLWSLYLGRPSSISTLVLLAVRRAAKNYPKDNTLHMWVQLCLRMLDIIEILNEHPSIRQLETNLRLCFHEANLRSAFEGLPPELSLDDFHVEELESAAYTPHIQFLGIQVTVNRAMIKAGLYQVHGRSDVQPKGLEQMNAMIHDNAVRIAKLVLSFRRMFGSENMVTVMLDNIYVAAIALMSHVVRIQKMSRPIETDVRWLHTLFEALESVERHFPIARRMRSSLGQMIKKTTIVHLFPDVDPPTPSTSSLPLNFTNQPNATPNQASQANFPEFSDVNLDFATEDQMWSHYLAWNMPFVSETLESGQFVPPNQSSPTTMMEI